MLTLVFVVTVVAGFIPGATVVWALSLVSGVALAAYVALLVRLRQRAEERERKLHYLRPGATNPRTGGLAIGGRYAHPSHQAVAR